jgi:hypothetical protein
MFNWLFGKLNKITAETTIKSGSKDKFLHGVNLTDWIFIGVSKLSYTYHNDLGQMNEYALVFHFVGRTKTNNRQLVIPEQLSAPFTDFTKHEWYTLVGSLWVSGELPLYHGINYYVSDHLKNHMALLHDHEWNPSTLQWQKINRNAAEDMSESPHNNIESGEWPGGSVLKPRSPIIHKSVSDSNGANKVITVNFGKKKDENTNDDEPRPA